MTKLKPIIWTISGSDCSGGAGIAADIKTGHGLGVEVCHLITANTVQNSKSLVSVNAVSTDILQQQVDILLHDKPPAVIKIGLIANEQQVLWLIKTLDRLKKVQPALITVFDPVGQASVGGTLSEITISQLSPLLAHIDIITPNVAEAIALAQVSQVTKVTKVTKVKSNDDIKVLAKKIYSDFAINSVIIKGGHSKEGYSKNNHSNDLCYHQLNQLRQDNQEKDHQGVFYHLSSVRINNHYTHGGGCCFASAIAAFLAHGYLVRDAFTLSKAFINQGLTASYQLSATQQHKYYGAFEAGNWPNNAKDFPLILNGDNDLNLLSAPFNSLELGDNKLGIYPVIDSLYWLKRLLPLGLKIIQLRVKDLTEDELEQIIYQAVELAKNYNTRLFINDYWQLAIKYGAYGVHIGQEDLADADLVQIHQAGLRLGISTHGCYEFLLAQQLRPSYLAIGAIFPTKTKNMTGQIQGLNNLRQLVVLGHKNEQIPIVAIGGINLNNAPHVLATGVDSIAVVTAITQAKQPEQAVKQFKQLIPTSSNR